MSDLDLRRLPQLHPELPASEASTLTFRAAHALLRGTHTPGATVSLDCDGATSTGTLQWDAATPDERALLDQKHLTEDGAYAVALVYAAERHGLRIRRRMQEGEQADWLLRDPKSKASVALEVGGTGGSAAAYVERKIEQVRKAMIARREAIVVGFGVCELVHRRVA